MKLYADFVDEHEDSEGEYSTGKIFAYNQACGSFEALEEKIEALIGDDN